MLSGMAKIKQNDNTKFRQGCGRTKVLIHSWWELGTGQLLWIAVWQFLMKNIYPMT